MLELATTKDRSDINRLARQVHEMHVQWRPDLYQMPEELYPEELFTELVKQRELYVAKKDGAVIGFVLIRMRVSEGIGKITRKIMCIDQLCVDEPLRNRGIGSQMMEDIHALARAFGCTDMKIGVYPQNEDAIRFYERFGFAIRSIDMQANV